MNLRKPAFNLERYHASEPGLLAHGELMMGMVFQPGIVYPPDAGMAGKKMRDAPGILFVDLHSRNESFDPPKDKPAVKRRGALPQGVREELDPVGQRLLFRDNGPSDDVAMAVEVLRGGMNDQVGAELERALVDRRQKRIIHDRKGTVGSGNVAERPDIQDVEQGIARRFNPDGLCVWTEGGGKIPGILQVNESDLEIKLFFVGAEDPLRSTVTVVRADDVISGSEEVKDGRDGGHSGGHGRCPGASFQGSDILFERLARGV